MSHSVIMHVDEEFSASIIFTKRNCLYLTEKSANDFNLRQDECVLGAAIFIFKKERVYMTIVRTDITMICK